MTPRALRQLLAEATPGPWGLGVAGNRNVVHFDGDDISGVCSAGTVNAALIVAAINELPALLDRLERYEAALREIARRLLEIDPPGGTR